MIDLDIVETIKEYIRKGYSVELISTELDFPKRELEELKKQIELENSNKALKNKYGKSERKLEYMRKRYQEFYLQDSISAKKEINNGPSEKEEKIINEVIFNLKNIVDSLNEDLSFKRINDAVLKFEKELRRINKINLTIDQATQIQNLVYLNDDLTKKILKDVKKAYNKYSQMIARKYIASIGQAVQIENDIDRLTELYNMLSNSPSEKKDPVYTSAIKSTIIRKKQKIENTNKFILPKKLHAITLQIAKGVLQLDSAQKIIDSEVKKNNSNTQNSFIKINEEKQREIVLSRIKQAIGLYPEKYSIDNPQKSLEQLILLCGGSLNSSLVNVLDNLLARNKIDEAKKLVAQYQNNSEIR